MIAWQAHQDGLCEGCGHPRVETFDPAFEGLWEADELVCHACAARDRAAEAYRRDDTTRAGGKPHGLRFHVHRD